MSTRLRNRPRPVPRKKKGSVPLKVVRRAVKKVRANRRRAERRLSEPDKEEVMTLAPTDFSNSSGRTGTEARRCDRIN